MAKGVASLTDMTITPKILVQKIAKKQIPTATELSNFFFLSHAFSWGKRFLTLVFLSQDFSQIAKSKSQFSKPLPPIKIKFSQKNLCRTLQKVILK